MAYIEEVPFDDQKKDRVASKAVREMMSDALLCEVSWEVCQQLGGIYTVIRSKVPSMVNDWGRRYCLVGPYNQETSPAEFEEAALTGPFGKAVKALQAAGIKAHYGHWLVTGRPRVILLDSSCIFNKISEIKYHWWEKHGINTVNADNLVDQVMAFGYLVSEFFNVLTKAESGNKPIIGHFHEWMAGSAIPEIRKRKLKMVSVFTTHATQLGRYLAMTDATYYAHLPKVDWAGEAKRFNIESKVLIERAATHGATVMSTVSEITDAECKHLLGRSADVLLPNGLNVERFAALHEFQNMHKVYKNKIQQFVMAHFFPSYTFNLDKTLFFVTSGRYEFMNKGFDLSLEALARLNYKMKAAKMDHTVIFFLVTKAACKSINPNVLKSMAILEEIRKISQSITEQIGERLFLASTMGSWPNLDDLVEDYWRLRLRRTLHAWKTSRLPAIITHDLEDDANDPILGKLRSCKLFNGPNDPVKVIYHPDFISSTNPLFGMDYDQFVRGCHLGIFPSAYEPWGYAPLECAVLGIPSITSDITGFGSYLQHNMPDHNEKGLMVMHRKQRSFDHSANELVDLMMKFILLDRRERIALRNRSESCSSHYDWSNLGKSYTRAHELALERM